jgi:hypothetical protein
MFAVKFFQLIMENQIIFLPGAGNDSYKMAPIRLTGK